MKPFKSYDPQELSEGVYDPNIFKAVFLAGGPGSGKSYVTSKVIGGLGLRIVNSDRFFTRLLKKHGLSDKMPDHEEHERTQQLIRAKELTAAQTKNLVKGRLGMIIDGTGGNFKVINDQVQELKQSGYDCYMIFVNTALDVAHERNKQRSRQVPEKIVTSSWNSVQKNMGKFQYLFGRDKFILIDNNNAKEDLFAKVHKQIRKLVTKPIENWIAKKWIDMELKGKDRS